MGEAKIFYSVTRKHVEGSIKILRSWKWYETLDFNLKHWALEKEEKINPNCQPHKMVKHIQTIGRQQPTNCLSVFDLFLRLVLKGLRVNTLYKQIRHFNDKNFSKAFRNFFHY